MPVNEEENEEIIIIRCVYDYVFIEQPCIYIIYFRWLLMGPLKFGCRGQCGAYWRRILGFYTWTTRWAVLIGGGKSPNGLRNH